MADRIPHSRGVVAWGRDAIEPGTFAQAEETALLPILDGPVALMPDAHVGKGSTVGSVLVTKDAVIPAAVGVDIGCGMIATRLTLTSKTTPDGFLDKVLDHFARVVPAGVGKGHDDYELRLHGEAYMNEHPNENVDTLGLRSKAIEQFGTLGSGNHFLELTVDEADAVWVVLHSGSRGVGNRLAEHHIAKALDVTTNRGDLPWLDGNKDLAWFQKGDPEFDAYLADMTWAQEYAWANRERMLANVMVAIRMEAPGVVARDIVNCHHNYTAIEKVNGEERYVTRKGAIRAALGERGVIPGSMATGSFIVAGKGNEASYRSCSHGAGRRMSRGQARRELTVESLVDEMGDRTWQADKAEALLDEHPDSYKDLESVMAAQADLVQVEHRLQTILNYKGTNEIRRKRKG